MALGNGYYITCGHTFFALNENGNRGLEWHNTRSAGDFLLRNWEGRQRAEDNLNERYPFEAENEGRPLL